MQNADFLVTFSRGLKVIKSFQYVKPALTLTEVAELNGLSRASARRFLLTLEALGYVKQEGSYFSLTAKILELSYGYLINFDIKGLVYPLLATLSEKLSVACSAAVLDGVDIVYIARSSNLSAKYMQIHVGDKLPAFATASGRVLISNRNIGGIADFFESSDIKPYTNQTIIDKEAFIKAIIAVKSNGYAIVNQELDTSLRAVAVPVFDASGNVVMSINLSQHLVQMTYETIYDCYIPELKKVAEQISVALPF